MASTRKAASGLLGVVGLAVLAGCSPGRMFLPAFHEIRGAKGALKFVDEPAPAELRRYGVVRFEPVTTTLGPRLCPAEVLSAYDQHARELTQELREYYTGREPTLTASSEILYFQEKGLLGAAQLLSRVRLSSGERRVGDAVVVVESKSFRQSGTDALAKTAVKTIGEFLKQAVSPEKELK